MHSLKKNHIFLLLAAAFLLCPCVNLRAEKKMGLKTVVIDAGHGGKDAGAVSKDKKTYEKTLTLDIAKRFGEKIKAAYPDVKVIYTRTTDVYKTLNERAAVANKNNADLFVSIHINSNNKSAAYGPSVHILGQGSKNDLFAGNMDVCRKENSVILLEDDYSTNYQGFDPSSPESFIFFSLMQNAFYEQSIVFASEVDKQLKKSVLRTSNYSGIHQDPFWLLWKTSMPAALIELGFISNPVDLQTLKSSNDRDRIAESLLKAFAAFKTAYDKSLDVKSESMNAGTAKNPEGSKPAEKETKAVEEINGQTLAATETKNVNAGHGENLVQYGVQIMCAGKILKPTDPQLKDYKASHYRVEGKNLYKYIVEISADKEDVKSRLPKVKKDFPDAFMVKIDGGTVTLER